MQDHANIAAIEKEILRAQQQGQGEHALRLWARLLELDPSHPQGLMAMGQYAFRMGNLADARALTERLVQADGNDPQQWINLAVICQAMGDEAGESAAITGCLTRDPSDLLGLIMRGNLLERQGKIHAAAQVASAIGTVAPPLEKLHPDLRPAVQHALDYRDQYNTRFGDFLDAYLKPHVQALEGASLKRFHDSVDIMFGRKKRYDSQPTLYYYPGLAPITFFDRADTPWIGEVEAQTDAIREEFLAVLAAEEGFAPYLTYPPDLPHNQFAELNNSPRWSAFHLYKDGLPVAGNVEKCPATMAMLAKVPQPDQPGRTPTAMFSLLKPHTRIPPHVGVSNVRMLCHLPLIIPENCGFRVGNDTRPWVPGTAFVFDDTIEHEAWNDSDKLRVILIFDVWHPHLSAPERALITALNSGVKQFADGEAGGGYGA
ncbi:aspartyl/asparaginyl beta-hydroxylase domain-containing protein [Massilia sp. TS11]|uniref:aspartyl/asparaginyl beta-hydroxylase domain-containing protein n=1 Tax=Massilia sp. TS11 TaxID=2908003 RepID=UPI001EDBD862|nr:aspartyl/asparaginyl beta-hydroxylase domain-containing protein [Massilia sp. TS11]